MMKTYGKRPYTSTYGRHHEEEHQGGQREEEAKMLMKREKIHQLLVEKGCQINALCVINLAITNPPAQLHQHQDNMNNPKHNQPNLNNLKHNQPNQHKSKHNQPNQQKRKDNQPQEFK